MFELPLLLETPRVVPCPRLLVELPSRPRVFLGNLRDVILPRRLPPLDLRSAPAAFWPDVFVKRGLPWLTFMESVAYHVIACTLLIVLSRFMALRPQVAAVAPTFDHTQVVYYQPSEYLPPMDTRSPRPAPEPAKSDPEFASQPIISVPPEADNRRQTVVTPPNIKLRHDVALPNIVAWSDKLEKPRLAIPAVPLTPAAERNRLAPRIDSPVVAPPPDAEHLAHRLEPNLQAAVVAPPPDLRTSRQAAAFDAPQPAVVAPPPAVANTTTRRLGELNVGHSNVIAPAPQLQVAEQRTIGGGQSSATARVAPLVVPPPPSISASGPSGQSFGSQGRIIALNLHPAVGAPPEAPPGNRRGAFAATPEGHAGASGSPGSSGTTAKGDGRAGGTGSGNGLSSKSKSDLPSGLYVGTPAGAKTSAVAGDPSGGRTVASAAPSPATAPTPRVSSSTARPASSGNAAKLSDAERAVFGDRRFYSLTLNMPNLNSSAGSWIIRFAELKQDSEAPAAEVSQPVATRKVDPGYPLQLMRENVAGTVVLYGVIRADGTVGNVRVLRGVDERLDKFASEAVAQWKFDPATKNGVPIDVEATFQIPFRRPNVGTAF
jgi:TonB family protein